MEIVRVRVWLHVISSNAISTAAISTAAISTGHTFNRSHFQPLAFSNSSNLINFKVIQFFQDVWKQVT